MKTLFCCGSATHTGIGQSGLWRWWYYYRPLKDYFGATHYAINNDGNRNLPNEAFVKAYNGAKPIPVLSEDQLNLVFWPNSLPRRGRFDCPGYYRSLNTMARIALEQNFDKLIYVEWDCWVLSTEMMREIARIDHGLIAYWSPSYLFPECNLIVAGKDQFSALKLVSERFRSKEVAVFEDVPEKAILWTEVRKHRVGDRYPDWESKLPLNVEYCAQLPNTEIVYNGKLVQLAQALCFQCGERMELNEVKIVSCRTCHPEQFNLPLEQ